jgi:hypothetical protein
MYLVHDRRVDIRSLAAQVTPLLCRSSTDVRALTVEGIIPLKGVDIDSAGSGHNSCILDDTERLNVHELAQEEFRPLLDAKRIPDFHPTQLREGETSHDKYQRIQQRDEERFVFARSLLRDAQCEHDGMCRALRDLNYGTFARDGRGLDAFDAVTKVNLLSATQHLIYRAQLCPTKELYNSSRFLRLDQLHITDEGPFVMVPRRLASSGWCALTADSDVPIDFRMNG